MRKTDPVRWGRRIVIGGAATLVSAWIGISVMLFKLFGG